MHWVQGGGGEEKQRNWISPDKLIRDLRVVEVQEVTQRKSLQGLDNTTAERADGF